MKVLLLSKYSRKGASSRLRTMQYIPFLESKDVEVVVSSLFDDSYLENLYSGKAKSKFSIIKYYVKRLISLLTVFKYDVVWIEYELFPYLPAYFEWFLAKLGVKYVVDYDDAIFHNYDFSANKWVRKLLSKKIDAVMKSSYCVTAGNTYLAERAFTAGAKDVVIVPTVVDHCRYKRTAQQNSELVIGWVGSPSTQKYILGLKQVLIDTCLRFGAKLVLVGAQAELLNDFSDIKVEVLDWNESTEADIISTFSIGIMPLIDGPWEKGKCGYKLIQYMASGKPVIATDVGVNKTIIDKSNAGYTVTNNEEWLEALTVLLSNNDLCYRLGNNARIAVEKHYSVLSQLPVITKILKQEM